MGEVAAVVEGELEPRKGKRGPAKGSRTRPKRALLALLDERYPGYQPVVRMAGLAIQLEDKAAATGEVSDLAAAAAAHDKVAQYVTPKLKAIEVTGANGEPIQVQFGLAGDVDL